MEQSQDWLSEEEIIHWWESRRLRFNLYVGIVGVLSWLLVGTAGSDAVKPGADFEEPIAMIIGPFVYGILANVCYTFGEFVDTIFYCGMPRRRLYKAGMIFSVILTGVPGVWAVLAWLFSVITGHKLDKRRRSKRSALDIRACAAARYFAATSSFAA
jgi:hypothetical protein